jgi:hypothetical protein
MSKDMITYAGVSRLNGELKFRTATTEGRVHQLARTDADVKIVSISPVATKSEAAKQLLATDFESNDAEIVAVLVSKAKDGNPFKAKKTVVVRVPTEAIRQLTGAQVEVSEPMTAREAKKVRDAWNRAHADLSYDGE